MNLIPATGDTSHIGLWITIMVVALIGLVVTGIILYVKSRGKK